MHPELATQLDLAHWHGLSVNLVTNGMMVSERLARMLLPHVHRVAVSLDGQPELHDRLRGQAGAFERALRGLRSLRDTGVDVAILHTATRESLADIQWLLDLARAEQISTLQIHPLEPQGRGGRLAAPATAADLATQLAILVSLLVRGTEDLHVHLDVLPLDCLPLWPDDGASRARLAEILDVLVVEPDGALSPWTYGAPRYLQLGRLGAQRLSDIADQVRREGATKLREHHQQTRQRLVERAEWPFVCWSFELGRTAAG